MAHNPTTHRASASTDNLEARLNLSHVPTLHDVKPPDAIPERAYNPIMEPSTPTAEVIKDEVRNKKNRLVFLRHILVIRLTNAWWLGTFFQPDEYFQALEPAWNLAFGERSGAWLTWVCFSNPSISAFTSFVFISVMFDDLFC